MTRVRLANSIFNNMTGRWVVGFVLAVAAAALANRGLLPPGTELPAVAGSLGFLALIGVVPVVAPLAEVNAFAGKSAKEVEDIVSQGPDSKPPLCRPLPLITRHVVSCLSEGLPSASPSSSRSPPLQVEIKDQIDADVSKLLKVWGEDALLDFPGAVQPVIDERDRYMAECLRKLASGKGGERKRNGSGVIRSYVLLYMSSVSNNCPALIVRQAFAHIIYLSSSCPFLCN